MLNKEPAQVEVAPKTSAANHNHLNDHDYCSPDKRSSSQQQNNMQSNNKTNEDSLDSQKVSTKCISKFDLNAPKTSVTSTSCSPNLEKNNAGSASDALKGIPKIFPGDLSDSSSSSSLSSSDDSSKGLVIAQDNCRPLAPKDTPSVSRHKGRIRKKDFLNSDQQPRKKRARQTTSVTDKSQWITGDDQIDSVLSEHLDDEPKEKRSRLSKKLDPEFETYSSSDYSSSDANSDADSDGYNSENDPDRLWCSCLQPHNDKFMICCDVCEYWYHGHCVGVTKLMGDRFDRDKVEWICQECQDKMKAGVPRASIPKKIAPKAKKHEKIAPAPGKRGRGRPRKSETLAREEPARMSLRNSRKSSTSFDSKSGLDNGKFKGRVGKSDARSESYNEFHNAQNLKQLIRERKREFFYKRSLIEQQKAAKRNELGLGRQSLTALSDSLDSLASSTSTPNMSNLPTNIKSGLKDRSKIVLQINTKKDPSSDSSDPNSRIVTAIVRSPKKKQQEPTNPVDDIFTADPIQVGKKVKAEPSTETSSSATEDKNRRLSSGSTSNKVEKPTTSGDQPNEPTTPKKKKRKDSESSTPNGSISTAGSKLVAPKIKEVLETRCKQMKDLEVKSSEIEKLATEIESQLNENFKEGSHKYNNKFRSLLFNLKDSKNEGLVKNVLTGEIQPAKLVKMTPDEMASHELAKWRERENKHSLELIKRDAQLAAQQVIVKKTHKGEEVISAPAISDPDETTPVTDSKGPQTATSKSSGKETISPNVAKISVSPSASGSSVKPAGSLKMKISGMNSDTSSKAQNHDSTSASTAPMEDSIAFLDTTKDHKNHVYDMNCRICTNTQIEEPSSSTDRKPTEEVDFDSKKAENNQQNQPKRFRVSIDTKLDPANLSRLKEPLIKPSQASTSTLEEDEYNQYGSPSHVTTTNCRTPEENFDDDSYDPEFIPSLVEKSTPPPKSTKSNEPVWTGTIAMPDIPKFAASARAVSGSLDFMKEEVNKNLMVCGRIAPDQVQTYIKKLRSTTKNQVLLIQLLPLNEDDKGNYNNFFDHLYSRNRCGVIEVPQQVLKDFYIIPIHENSNIPEAFKPIDGPGLDRKLQPNCLVGLLVRTKRSSPTLSTYTPTPIK